MAKKINTEMELRKVKLSDLVPYENNPRNNDEAVPDVEESMVQTGYNSPIVVSKDMVILAGHTRLKSLLDAGVEEAPVVVIDRTAEQYKKFRILDNKTGEKAGWDFSKLEIELDGMDFDGFDFDFDYPARVETAEEIADEKKGSLAKRYLVPPFSVIYCNKLDWLARKRAWVARGLRSELGRGGETCLQYNEQGIQEQYKVKQLHDKSQALATYTIARMRQMKGL